MRVSTPTVATVPVGNDGTILPITATADPLWILIGVGMLMTGGLGMGVARRVLKSWQ